MGIVPFYTKTPDEKFSIGLDFTDEMPSDGITISSGEVTARNRITEADATSVILTNGSVASIDVSNNIARILVADGITGVWYEVLFVITCSNGHKLNGKAIIFVDS